MIGFFMQGLDSFYTFMDQWLMPVYRLVETPILGFYLGTAALALCCVLIGELPGDTIKMNNLSIEALQAGDGVSYRACNKMANDSFSKMFFLQLALSTATLWPAAFAMAWMQHRFYGIYFPLWGLPVVFNFAGVFLPLYVLIRLSYGKIKGHIPLLRTSQKVFSSLARDTVKMKSWQELFRTPAKESR